MSYIGTKKLIGGYIGLSKIKKIYVDTDVVYQETSTLKDYLCFTANTAGSTITLSATGSPSWTGSYSTNGSTWTTYEPGTTGAITLLSAGSKIYFKGVYTAANSASNYLQFSMTGSIAASGNIMSFCSGDSFESITTIPYNYMFSHLFYNCTSLTTAPSLPATTITGYCYQYLFYGCTRLTVAPSLPATALKGYCYGYMFYGCTSLTASPVILATTLSTYCCYCMFQNCTSLTTVPKLSATKLYTSSYRNMFYGCTSLQVSDTSTSSASYAWTIPATGTFTNTASYGQNGMFTSCLGTRSSDNMSGAKGESHTYYTQNNPV